MYAHSDRELEMEFELEGEFEHEGELELEGEGEAEGEQFFGGLLGGLLGEGEGEHELHEHELHEHELHEHELHEHELHEHEHEAEAEQFFGRLARVAARAERIPALRRLGLQAARRVMATERAFEAEGEGELELEVNPVRKVYLDAMMEHMGHAAAEAETEQEAAEAFLPLIPLAMKALPLVGKLAMKAAPSLIKGAMRIMPRMTRGISQVARTLHRNPGTRPLLRAVPQIARRAATIVGRQLAAGRPVRPRDASRVLAQQAARVIGDPRQLVHAWRRSRTLDRQHHHQHPGAMRLRRPQLRRGHPPWSYGGWAPSPVASPAHGATMPALPATGHLGPYGSPHGPAYGAAHGPVCVCGHPIAMPTCRMSGR